MDWNIIAQSEAFTIAIIICIIIGSLVATRTVRWLINRSLNAPSLKLSTDPTRYKFFKNAVSAIIWIIATAAIVSLIPELKALAITLFAGAGILVAIAGFAAQAAFSNIISGLFIVVSKPFRVGDLIKVGSLDYGTVEDITLRHTVINNFENKRIIIPNSVISSETIINDSIEDEKICRFIEIGISYDSSVELASKIMSEECEKHPLSIDIRSDAEKESGAPYINIRLIAFNDFSILLRAYVWTKSPIRSYQMHSDLNKSIKLRFDDEGVEIPFPYRTVVFKNDLLENSKTPLSDE